MFYAADLISAAKLELCCNLQPANRFSKKVTLQNWNYAAAIFLKKVMLQSWNYAANWNYAAVSPKIKVAA